MFMVLDQELIALNQRGFIPGPSETKEEFLARVHACETFSLSPQKFFESQKLSPPFPLDKIVPRHHWDLKRSNLIRLFDISPDWLIAYYHPKGLKLWHGAMTWILQDPQTGYFFTLLQFRTKKIFFGMYAFDELFAHEAAHAARMAFQENSYEEIFAYLTSSVWLRRIFGPIVQRPWELWLFTGLLGSASLTVFLNLIGNFYLLTLFVYFIIVGYVSLGVMRLLKKHRRFKKAYAKLKTICKPGKVYAFLFRLTDNEINFFSKSSVEEIIKYFSKESSLRWHLLRQAYLQ